MIRFPSLERVGVSAAAMSGISDGDCGSRIEALPAATALLRGLSIDPGRLVRVRQVHSVLVHEASACAAPPEGPRIEGDGLMTDVPGMALGVSVADCAAVLLYDPARPAVAALHAGRLGTLNDMAGSGVRAMQDRFGSIPERLHAVVSPCAGLCCYEVGEEDAELWRAAGLPAQGRRLDIGGANRKQLEKAGLIVHNIQVVPHCTVCGGGFFSYRADKTSKRNLVVVML